MLCAGKGKPCTSFHIQEKKESLLFLRFFVSKFKKERAYSFV